MLVSNSAPSLSTVDDFKAAVCLLKTSVYRVYVDGYRVKPVVVLFQSVFVDAVIVPA